MVQDWYGDYPAGPTTGRYRVIRGGSWCFFASFARSANRFKNIPEIAGFRLVLVATPASVPVDKVR